MHSQQVFNEIADGHYLHSPAMDSGGGTYFDFRWRGDPAFLFRLEIQMEWDPHDPTSETLQLVASVDADRSRFDQPEVNGSSPLVLRLDPMPSSIIEKPRIYFGSVPDYSAPVSLTFVALEQPVRVTLMETYRC